MKWMYLTMIVNYWYFDDDCVCEKCGEAWKRPRFISVGHDHFLHQKWKISKNRHVHVVRNLTLNGLIILDWLLLHSQSILGVVQKYRINFYYTIAWQPRRRKFQRETHTQWINAMFAFAKLLCTQSVDKTWYVYIYMYITLLALIKITEDKQNLVCNNSWFKLQPAVILQNGSITAGCFFNIRLMKTIFCL